MPIEDSDEQLARANEELLWQQEQNKLEQVNINWQLILKRAHNDNNNDLPG